MEFKDFSLLVRDTRVRGFAEGLEQGKLLGSRCKTCGLVQYPPRSDCPQCRSSEFEWMEITGQGRLLTYTSIHVTPDHFTPDLAGTAPFSAYRYVPAPVGIVEMENGLRVMGWIRGPATQATHVGMILSPRAEVLDDGRATVVLVGGEE